jgi:hypothetical protein
MRTHKQPFAHDAQTTSLLSRRQVRADLLSPAAVLTSPAHPVTNLEAVVLQMQDANRDMTAENTELRAQNQQLRNEARDREKFWRALWQARSTGMPPDPMDDSALPSYARIQHSSPMTSAPNRLSSVSPTTVGQYPDPRSHFPTGDPSTSAVSQQPYHGSTATEYMHRSSALGFAPAVAATVPGPSRPSSADPQHMNAYAPYPPYASEGSSPEESWQQHGITTPVTDRSHIDESPSPTYVESPSLTSSELAYPSHPAIGDEQKMSMHAASPSMYMYTASRSTSPASTPTSTSSASLAAAPYQFTFPEGTAIQDRPEFNLGRPNGFYPARAPELTLHGGTAHVPIAGSLGDALRYRLNARANTFPTGAATHPYPRTDRESDEDDALSPQSTSRLRGGARRSTIPPVGGARSSTSPPPRLSSTLAVIKAQSFGGLRRTRTKGRRSSDNAVKLSVEALSARGISVTGDAPVQKRQKRNNDPGDDGLQ